MITNDAHDRQLDRGVERSETGPIRRRRLMKRLPTPVLALSFFALAQFSARADGLKPTGHVEIYESADTAERMTLVPLEPDEKDQYLIKYENIKGPWKAKILLARRSGSN